MSGKWRGYLKLTAIFVVAFSLPLGAWYLISQPKDSTELLDKEDGSYIKASIPISDFSRYISVADGPGLNPQASEDFILFSWIRPRSFPEDGQDIVYLAKIGPDPAKEGYGLGYRREGREVRPIVHWKDKSGVGDRFVFSEMSILPREWVLLVVSFLDGRYLAVHSAQPETDGGIEYKLLGAHDISNIESPAAESNLVLGALQHGPYRGRIGPFGILSGQALSENLEGLVYEIVKLTRQEVDSIENTEIKMLMIEPGIDLSANQNEIDLSSFPRFSSNEQD